MIKPISNLRGAVVVWLISFVFFLVTLTNNFSASHDSIHYLLAIANGEHLFHQHHLLYHYYAHTWLILFRYIFPAVPDHYLIESFTAVWGSANLAVCYLFFRNRFNISNTTAVAGVALIAFSYGTWFYSVNIEVYAPPIFFILCCLYIITKKEPVRSDAWKIAILHSMGILFHQVNILFAVVVLYWLWVNRRRFSFAFAFIQYALIGVILAGGVYVFCGVFYEHTKTLEEFTGWILGYTSGDYTFWQPLSIKTPVNAVAGFSRAFIGGHFVFQLPYIEDAVGNSFRSHGLKDEIFLSRNVPSSLVYVLSALTAVVVLFLIVMAGRFARSFKKFTLHHHVIKPLLVCIGVYSVFFLFWMPEILEFWILQMMLVWLLLVGMLPAYRFPSRLALRTGLILMCICVFCVNYFGSIRWLQDPQSDWYFVEVKTLDPTLTESDMVVVENEWIMKDYVRYFSKAKVIATDEPRFNREEASRIVNEAVGSGHKVFLFKAGSEPSWVLIQSY
ncbi:MAG: glycosyltransferase family 39 protein [Chitinophagaceae bacterium]|nr:glycosyltransferase family 39 protein [Chitinophagaceae bacterium]